MARTSARKSAKHVTKRAQSPTKPFLSDALKDAIKTLSAELLRRELDILCHEFPAAICTLENRLLVQGKDVVRYHVDTDSEDNTNSEIESEESDSDSNANDKSESTQESKKRKLITVGDKEYTPRMATCENCKQEFDVTLNSRGDCVWHRGAKVVDYESDIWDDHDENCHGSYESFEGDPDYAEGFLWDCCDKLGDDEGCKMTRHKTKMNVVLPAQPPVVLSNKRMKVGK